MVIDDEDNGLLLACVDPATPVQSDSEDVRHNWKMQHQFRTALQSDDPHFLSHDLREMIPISEYDVNDQDDV